MSGNHLITRDNADNVWVAEIQNFQISDNTPPPPPHQDFRHCERDGGKGKIYPEHIRPHIDSNYS
jgi:hypothetical protein